jgi:hypothetical protein
MEKTRFIIARIKENSNGVCLNRTFFSAIVENAERNDDANAIINQVIPYS